jgi:cold shock CspA family protein
MAQGTVLFFNYTERGGFGFIADDAADKANRAQNVYFTSNMITNGSSAATGDRALFDYCVGNSGKGPEARSVTLCDEIET